ncbi:Uncharacterised protein [Mycobacteroides abscessus subsp. abscessus]|nr:Uncharacterised protein [Mycobacteroides abscessus subsp. abscessus]
MSRHRNPLTSTSLRENVLGDIAAELRTRSALATATGSSQLKITAEHLAVSAASALTPPGRQDSALEAGPTADWYAAERPWLDPTRDPQARFGALWDAAGRCRVPVSTAEILTTRTALYRWSATRTVFTAVESVRP